jgi:hypothetical protein
MDEVRPLTGAYMPDIFRGVAERYQFTGVPSDIADAIQNGAKFAHGRLLVKGQTVAVTDIGIFNDGLIVGAMTTDLADIILDDFLSWITSMYHLRERIILKPRTYTSNLVVEFDKLQNGAITRLENISRKLARALSESRGWNCDIDVQRVAVQTDPLDLLPHMMPLTSTQFAIERRGGVPYSEGRFWSTAPLRTSEHLTLLESIEEDLL